MNVVILIGRLTKDNDVKYRQEGGMIVNNTIAVNRDYKNANGEYDTDFINFSAFGKTAEFLNNYIRKGVQVALEGSWQVKSYQASDGTTRVSNTLAVNKVTLLESIKQKEEVKSTPVPTEQYELQDDDLPF